MERGQDVRAPSGGLSYRREYSSEVAKALNYISEPRSGFKARGPDEIREADNFSGSGSRLSGRHPLRVSALVRQLFDATAMDHRSSAGALVAGYRFQSQGPHRSAA